MRYPAFLQDGGTIGFPAPSFGVNTEPYMSAFRNALHRLSEQGYGVEPGPNAYEGSGIGISNTPEKCGAELTDMYLSDRNDALISCGGGELMCEILDYVDFEKIGASAPKWFLGYSDNTNFTFLLPTLCDTAAVYGPCAASFGMEPWDPSLQDHLNLITGKSLRVHGYEMWEKESLKDELHPLEPYHLTEPTVIRSVNWDGKPFSGRFLGGCMDCLVNFPGTKYDRVAEFSEKYRDDGIIFFLEACDLNVFGIRRTIWHMEHAGWFQYVKGFIIGRPLCMGQSFLGLDQYSALEPLLKYNVPVIMDADLGHLPPAMPFLSGGYGTVSKWQNNISIDYELK